MTESVSVYLMKYHRGPDAELKEAEFYLERAELYRSAWSEFDTAILTGITDLLDLRFYLPVIDVTLAPMVPSFSTPLIINYRYSPDEFVDTLAHELIHVLLNDNKEQVDFGEFMKAHWPQEEPKTRIHVLVHAVLEHLYLNVLHEPERLSRDVSSQGQNIPYRRAWAIVEEESSDNIVKDIREYVVIKRISN